MVLDEVSRRLDTEGGRDDAGSHDGGGAAGKKARTGWTRHLADWWIALAAGLVALGIGCYQLSLPNVLTGFLPPSEGYDDGVYIGVGIRLWHGVLPYRDFAFVHPPGIALLTSPAVLAGIVTGSSANALILARIATVLVVAVNVVLVGRLVRPIGRIAVAVSSFALALWPLTVGVDRTLELEPYLVLFCLLGAILVFSGKYEFSPRRTVTGGLAFGFAFAIKVWAIMPIVAVLAVFLPRWRREGRWLVAGMAIGFLIPCLPFFLAAPHSFVHDVFLDQLHRQNATLTTPFGQRLLLISGLAGLTAFSVASAVAVVLFILVGAAILVVYGLRWRRRSRLEWYVLLAATTTFIGLFDAPYLEPHYTYFSAAFFAPLVGVCTADLTRLVRKWARADHWKPSTPRIVVAASLLAVAAGCAFFVQQEGEFARSYLAGATAVAPLQAQIPAGACVISDYPGSVVMANRFTASSSGCPAVIDPYGMYLSDDDGSSPHVGGPFPATFELKWFSYLQSADYVELRVPFSDFVPWSESLILWFQQNYRQIGVVPDDYGHPIYLYERIR